MVTSVWRDSSSSPVNMAQKYELHALKMTRWAKILRPPTLSTTSQSSRCRRSMFSSVSVTFGCFSDVWVSRAGEGGRSAPLVPPLPNPVPVVPEPPVAAAAGPLPRPVEPDSKGSPILFAAKRSGAEAQPHTASIYIGEKVHK